jgi:hypothetical protein
MWYPVYVLRIAKSEGVMAANSDNHNNLLKVKQTTTQIAQMFIVFVCLFDGV